MDKKTDLAGEMTAVAALAQRRIINTRSLTTQASVHFSGFSPGDNEGRASPTDLHLNFVFKQLRPVLCLLETRCPVNHLPSIIQRLSRLLSLLPCPLTDCIFLVVTFFRLERAGGVCGRKYRVSTL